jgi:hypothetical protein
MEVSVRTFRLTVASLSNLSVPAHLLVPGLVPGSLRHFEVREMSA